MKKSNICFVLNKFAKHSLNSEEVKSRKNYLQNLKHRDTIDPLKLNVGTCLDVRDTLYVWCTAIITDVIETKTPRVKILKVHYLGWSNYYDEFIPSNSSRVAKIGTFTEKTDIAKYQIYSNEEEGGLDYYYVAGSD